MKMTYTAPIKLKKNEKWDETRDETGDETGEGDWG